MQNYLASLKKWNHFSGRATRKEYWLYYILPAMVLISVLFLEQVQSVAWLANTVIVFVLLLLVLSIAVFVRRLHDTNRSGWWYFISFIPIVGGIIQLIWICTDGTVGPNKYGPDPKNRTTLNEDTLR